MKKIWNKLKSLITHTPPEPQESQEARDLLALAKKHGKGESNAEIKEQMQFCFNCPIGQAPDRCYAENGQGLVLWLEDRRVTHCTSAGDQFSYIARVGIQRVLCPVYQAFVDVRVYEATVACDVLFWGGQELNFMGKSEATVTYHDDLRRCDWFLAFKKPMFSIQAAEPSWEAFTEIIEKECENKDALREFLVEEGPLDEDCKYRHNFEVAENRSSIALAVRDGSAFADDFEEELNGN